MELSWAPHIILLPEVPFDENKVIDSSGDLKTYSEFETPYSSMVHDFIVTSEHVIFPIFPLIIDFNQLTKGQPPIVWDSNRVSQIGIMPRSVEEISIGLIFKSRIFPFPYTYKP